MEPGTKVEQSGLTNMPSVRASSNKLQIVALVLLFVLTACVESVTEEKAGLQKAGSDASPTPDTTRDIPVVPVRKLDRRQKRNLGKALPARVREALERADYLEVFGLSSEDKAGIGWYPDVRVRLPLGPERTQLLTSFFFDASAGPNASACFIPRHGLKAHYKGKTVEVIICYQCRLFVVKGDLGEFDGGLYEEGSAAYNLFENVIRNQ